MPDATLDAALREAYVAARQGEIIFHTLELQHPAFVDDQGRPSAIRVVRDREDLVATLEADAPLNAGEAVTFTRFWFEFSLPQVDDSGVPEMTLRLDNVSREILVNIERALTVTDPVEMRYRPYLSSDLSRPRLDPVPTLVLSSVKAEMATITATARMRDVANRAFPYEKFTAERFPGL